MIPRGAGRLSMLLAMAVLVAAFVALGIWQIERRSWKLALIAQVEQRLAAPPIPAPGPAYWHGMSTADAYRRVAVHGTLRHDRETLVKAVTELGGGFWVMTPLETDRGFTVLVNSGFVPADRQDPARRRSRFCGGRGRGEQPVTIHGLLRLSEPRGAFLRLNDAAVGRWYSRDVAAIAKARGLGTIAPYFIDADATPIPDWPRGGLTVVRFPNNHLVYAITWLAMAVILAGVLVRMLFSRRRTA